MLHKERESSFGEHMSDYGHDLKGTYFDNKKGMIDTALGAVGAAANVILKGGDELFKGVIGQEYNSPRGIAGHTRADLGSLLSNIMHLRPLRAASDIWSLATADIPLDAINLITGNNISEGRNNAKNKASKVLAA